MTEGRDTTAVDEPCLGFDSDGVPFGDCANCGLARGVHPEPAGRQTTPTCPACAFDGGKCQRYWSVVHEVYICTKCGQESPPARKTT